MFKRAIRLAAVAMAIAAAGCSGSDGAQGPAGPRGNPGADGLPGDRGPQGPAILAAEQCALCHGAGQAFQPDTLHDAVAATALARGTATILTADFTPEGATTVVKPTITFQVRNAAGAFVDNWGAFNFTVAKLVPGTTTTPEHWLNLVSTGGREAAGPNIFTSAATAGANLSFNAGTHTYTFKYGTDIGVAGFDPDIAQTVRFGFQVTTYSDGSVTPAYDMTNGAADFRAAPGGAATALGLVRDIATTNACNKCHGKLAIHGRRVEVAYCSTCHNMALTDGAGSGDMSVYIHKLHGREKLANPNLTIFGRTVPADITYPQSIGNCDTCHQGADGARWNTNPSRYACTSCHDDVTFDSAAVTSTVRLHTGGAVSRDTSCLGCHAADGNGNGRAIIDAHTSPVEAQAAHFLPRIIKVTRRAGFYPAVQFSIVDPLNANSVYPLSSNAFRQGGASSLTVLVGLGNNDYASYAYTTFGQPVNVDLIKLVPGGAAVGGNQLSGQLVDGSYVLTIDQALPAGFPTSGTVEGTVAIQGHPAGSGVALGARLPMKNVSKAYRQLGSTTSSPPTARRAVVDINKCNDCHKNLSLHGNNRTGDITTCTICHNPEATDGSRRPNLATPGTLGVDGNLEEGIDFKYMIHKIHGHGAGKGITVYGYGGTSTSFAEVKYPGVLSNCQACHIPGTYVAPLSSAKGTTTFAGADRTGGADNLRTTKYLATCGGCHDSGAPADHITGNGGNTGFTQAEIDALNR